ncbi:MAG: rRNA pseudouridine synthase [Hyphomicrobiales bacterium]|nr:rRNA pseudouridine synthase [Hyphomicrobiales bacterium]MDE2114849.1 rRNA pseudouridine synthase [Hyphomicrobiales bacterium]
MKHLRLDRLLANMGYGSRREVEALARAGKIVLDGEAIHEGDQHIYLRENLSQRMLVDGEALDPPPGMALMLHKPLGVTCSHKEAGPLVYGLLPARWRRRDPAISTVGRLDKETSGLLLLTDDGALLHRIISPRAQIAKRYLVHVATALKGDEAQRFAKGDLMLEGEDTPLLPAEFQPLSAMTGYLTLHEGRYHQVRRMFAAIGNHVEALHRDRIGGLDLPNELAPGQYQLLDANTLACVFDRG